MEKCILDLVFNGLLRSEHSALSVPSNSSELTGRTILILNGGTILGRTASTFLASKGANLCICGVGLGSQLKTTENSCAYPVESLAQMKPNLIEKILNKHGPIDIAMIDFGTNITQMASNFENEVSLNKKLERNFTTYHEIALTLEKRMSKQSSGRIVFLAPWGWDKFVDPLHYETVKAGVIAFTKTLAERLAYYHINVNCVVPGFIKGNRPFILEKEYGPEVLKEIPMKLFGEVRDVLEAIYFLSSDVSKYITGQVLEVSGGFRS